jgi:gliding motility-associated-like protein
MRQIIIRYSFPILLAVFFSLSFTKLYAQPNWSVNPVDFGSNMSYIGWVIANGDEQGNSNDKLGAFFGLECRGVVSPSYNSNTGQWMFYLTVYGDVQGQVISFIYYDSQLDQEFTLETTVPFISNHQYGSPLNPKPTVENLVDITDADMISFSLPNQLDSKVEGDTIYVIRSPQFSTTDLIATFTTSLGASVKIGENFQFSSITLNNFPSIVTYTVTSGDVLTTKNYYVKLVYIETPIVASVIYNEEESNHLQDTLYAFVNDVQVAKTTPQVVAGINKYRYYFDAINTGQNDTLTFEFFDFSSGNYVSLVPEVVIGGRASIGTSYNPVVLSNVLLTDTDLLTFEIPNQFGVTMYDADTIIVRLDPIHDYESLVPEFTSSPGTTVMLNDSVQYTGFTVANFLNDTLVYRVYNQPKTAFKDYYVRVVYPTHNFVTSVWIDEEELTEATDSLFAYINDYYCGYATPTYVEAIDKYRFEIEVLHHYPLGEIEFIYKKGSTEEEYTLVQLQNFEDGSVTGSLYNPIVLSNVLLTGTDLLTFEIPNQFGVTMYDADTIIVRLDPIHDYESLVPEFTSSPGTTVMLNDSVQYTGFTVANFLNDTLVYRVYNQPKTEFKDYYVRVVYPTHNFVTSVWIDEEELTEATDSLFAYINDYYCGYATPTYVEAIDKYRFEIEVLHHYPLGEIEFIYKKGSTEEEYTLVQLQNFEDGSVTGSLYNPIVLSNVLLTGTDLLTFEIPNQIGETVYAGDSIFIVYPSSLSTSDLVPVFQVSPGAIVTVADSTHYSGFTALNFNDIVTYRVYNQTHSLYHDYFVKQSYQVHEYNARVLIEGSDNLTVGDSLFAYIDGRRSGQVKSEILMDLNQYRFSLPVHHFQETGIVSFTYYRAIDETEIPVIPNMNFTNGMIEGTLFDPIIFSNIFLSGNNFLTFDIPDQLGETVFYSDTLLITPDVLMVDFSALTPIYTASDGVKVYVNDSIQYSGFTEQDFSSTVNYKIQNWDNTSVHDYFVKVRRFAYELNAAIIIDDVEVDDLSDTLLVYHNDYLVGKSTSFYQPEINRYRFNVLFNHYDEFADFNFKFLNSLGDTTDLVDVVTLTSLNGNGTNFNPIKLSNTPLANPSFVSFTVENQLFDTQYDGNTILIRMPLTTALDALIPTFEVEGHAIAMVNDSIQYSDFTELDFSFPRTYRLYSYDKSSFENYLVKVVYFYHDYTASVWIDSLENTAPTDTLFAYVDSELSGWNVPVYVEEIEKYRFELTAVHTSNLADVSFVYYQSSTNNLFPLVGVYTFEDGSVTGSLYNPVVLSNVLLTDTDLLTFEIPNQFGVTMYDADTIIVRLDPIHDYESLVPEFTSSPGTTVMLNDSVQYTGFTVANFLNDTLVYRVYNQPKTAFKDYYVRVVYPTHNFVTSVWIDEEELTEATDSLFAYINDYYCGYATPTYVEAIDKYRFEIEVLHHYPLGEIEFIYKKGSTEEEYTLVQLQNFEDGSVTGSLYNPIVLSNVLLTGTDLLTFEIPNQFGVTMYDADTIIVRLDPIHNYESLVPEFTSSPGTTVMLNDSVQYTGFTVANFLNDTLVYRVYNQPKTAFKDYYVRVVYPTHNFVTSIWIDEEELTEATDSLFAYINDYYCGYATPTYVEAIDKYRFEIEVLHHYPLGEIEFIYKKGSTEEEYTLVQLQNFEDGSVTGSLYNPIVLSNVLLTGTDLLTFEIPNQFGVTMYDADTIIVRLDPIHDYESLVPEFTSSPGTTVMLNDSVQYTGFTVANFLNDTLVYRVYNQPKTEFKDYYVRVVYPTHNFVTSVWIDEEELTEATDSLFAYINDYYCGYATPTYVEAIDKYRFEIEVLHHYPLGEIEFIYKKGSTEEEYTLVQLQNFEDGSVTGSLYNPIVLSNVLLTGTDLLTFEIPNQLGETYFVDTTIIVKLDPQNNDYATLTPVFSVSPGAIVEVVDSVFYSGITSLNLHNKRTYTVFNFDRSLSQSYTVEVVYYTMDATLIAFVDSNELKETTDVIYAFIGTEQTSSSNYVSDALGLFRFEMEIVNYFSDGDEVSFAYQNNQGEYVYFPQKVMFTNIESLGDDYDPFVLSNPSITSCDLLSFDLAKTIESSRIEGDTIKLFFDKEEDLSSLSASFLLSEGSKLYYQGMDIMYTDLTHHDFSEEVMLSLVCGNEIVVQNFTLVIYLNDFSKIASSSLVSPNGDGVNDTWNIKDVEKYFNSKFKIYDNHARLVFESIGYDNSWQGDYGGTKLPKGSYFYTIETPDGTIHKGVISLLY